MHLFVGFLFRWNIRRRHYNTHSFHCVEVLVYNNMIMITMLLLLRRTERVFG